LRFTKDTTAAGAIVHTDGLQSYRALARHGYDHHRLTQTAAAGEQLLPRAHRAISNLKAWMHGTHRGVSSDHLPAYLDEFVRHEALLDRAGCETSPSGCRSSPEKLRAA